MKKIIILRPVIFVLALLSTSLLHAQSVAINTDGTTAHASALLDIKSSTKGMLAPRMTSLQRAAIATPAAGLFVYDTDTNSYWYFNGAAWNVLSAGASTNFWSLSGSDIYNNNAGNVGIGTAAPFAYGHGGNNRITEISNPNTGSNIQSHLILSTNGTSGSAGGITWASQNVPGTEKRLGFIGDVYETSNAARMVFYTRAEAGDLGERLTVLGNGNVGIGTTTPAYKMDVSDRIRIRSGVNSTAGLWLNNPGNSATIAFMGVKEVDVAGIYGNVSGWGLLMNTNTGAVGIGYQNPVAGYRLSVLGNQYINGLVATTGDAEIGGDAQVSGNLNVGGRIVIGALNQVGQFDLPTLEVKSYVPYQSYSGWSYFNNTTWAFNTDALCIRAHGAIMADYFIAISDTRVKNIAGISNSAKDLETINALQITDYTMKDKIKYGNKPFKKVIAQQVEKVYPQVISTNKGYIPNVYAVPSKIEKTANGYLLSFTDKHNLTKTAKKIQLMMERDTKQFDIVSIPSDMQVEIKVGSLKTDKVFVYGEEVDDFKAVDYEGLTTLNISATQELSKLIDAQNKKIAELAEEIKLLKEKTLQTIVSSK